MNFDLVFDPDASGVAWALTLLGLFLWFGAGLTARALLETDYDKTAIALFAVAVIGLVPMGYGFKGISSSDNEENLESNLKMKYGIESIIDDPEYPVSHRMDKEQEILVELSDGRKAAFVLTQDFETQEPTLSDVEVPLNTVPEVSLSDSETNRISVTEIEK